MRRGSNFKDIASVQQDGSVLFGDGYYGSVCDPADLAGLVKWLAEVRDWYAANGKRIERQEAARLRLEAKKREDAEAARLRQQAEQDEIFQRIQAKRQAAFEALPKERQDEENALFNRLTGEVRTPKALRRDDALLP